jgi:cell division protein FtsW (lipid II flippase)
MTNLPTTADTAALFRSRISAFLLIGGCLCTCANVPISLVLMHVGLAMMAAGVFIGARPVHRLPGFTWGCLFAAWQIIGILFRPEHDPRPLFRQGHGTTFIWFALFPAILVLAEPRWRRWAIRLMVLAVLASFIVALLQFFYRSWWKASIPY